MTTPETTTERPPVSQFRWLYDAYTQTQKLRISIGNRISAVERGTDDAPLSSSIGKLYKDLGDGEKAIFKDMGLSLKGHAAWRWLQEVKGIGPTLATKLIALIEPIERFATVSKLWRYSGYAVIHVCQDCGWRGFADKCYECGSMKMKGQRERPVKGEKLTYNIKLKTALYLCAESFLKQRAPYRAIYDEARVFYLARETGANLPDGRKPWTDGHQHMASMRKMSKIFLQHLWLTWREAEGLSIESSYVEAHMGHTHIIAPWDMVGDGKSDG